GTVTPMGFGDWDNIQRRHVLMNALLAVTTSVVVILVYAVAPISQGHTSILLRLTAGLVFFGVVLVYEVRAIVKAPQPILRAARAMALVIPIFIVVFAWTYLTMARSDPTAFSEHLDRISSLYFTVTVLTTVGFGDIAPKTDAARVAVTLQMLCDV